MTPKNTKPAIKRRDGAGHIDPTYARELLEQSGKSDDGNDRAFLDGARSGDELAEELGEAFVASATSGEEAEPERHDRVTEAERGGPFVGSTAGNEFAEGTDASNPEDAEREAFPTTSGTGGDAD
ncbi:MAG: hypothetical protein WKG00_07595 [Polyangiaceae bacterium]